MEALAPRVSALEGRLLLVQEMAHRGHLRAAKRSIARTPAKTLRQKRPTQRRDSGLPVRKDYRGRRRTTRLRRRQESARQEASSAGGHRRRIVDQERYDDGVARIYRTVEMWYQWRLQEQHAVSTERTQWEKLDKGTQGRFVEASQRRELPENLGLHDARLLTRILENEPLEEEKPLQGLLRQRNRSILAHGLEPISKKAASRFLEYVDSMVHGPEAKAGAAHAYLGKL